jgi:hypothetical protein
VQGGQRRAIAAVWIAATLGCASGSGGNDDGAAEGLGEGSTAGRVSGGDDGPGDDGPGDDGPGNDGPGDDGPAQTGDDASTSSTCEVPTTWYADDDGDGFGDPSDSVEACSAPPGYIDDADDCDDDDNDVHPGAIEPCGGPDLDCDRVEPELCGSCLELLGSGNGTADGLYTIDIDGEAGSEPPLQVYCDQSTDGGGWTLVQRTVWNPALTAVLNTTYAAWYGVTVGAASDGAYRLRGGLWSALNDQNDHLLRLDVRDAADGSDCAPLFYVGTGGVLDVSPSTATLTGLTASVTIANGPELTTTDTGPSATCIASGAVPWFYGECCATCPTYQGGYWNEPHPMASYPDEVADLAGQTTADVCPGGPQLSINPEQNYIGVNQMSYWLR